MLRISAGTWWRSSCTVSFSAVSSGADSPSASAVCDSFSTIGVPETSSPRARIKNPGKIDSVRTIEIGTPSGPARAHIGVVGEPCGALVLGHGAGGGVEAPDLVAARKAAHSERLIVALVEQPYRVAGRRSPARAP